MADGDGGKEVVLDLVRLSVSVRVRVRVRVSVRVTVRVRVRVRVRVTPTPNPNDLEGQATEVQQLPERRVEVARRFHLDYY